jgi:protein TonB
LETPPPPPPQEKQEQPPEPKLDDAPKPLSLNFDLDVAVGEGGVLSSLMGDEFSKAAESMQDLAFSMAELDKQPVLLASVSPRYPKEMRKARIEGSVVILFVLNEFGKIEDPRVESSSRTEFEKPALDAVKKWKFKPGMKEGEAVRTYMRLPMRFGFSS